MNGAILTLLGTACLGLTGCVVQPPPPPMPAPAPVVVAPPVVVPAVVAPEPPVVVRPRVWHRRCPPGYHLGPQGRRCWPN